MIFQLWIVIYYQQMQWWLDAKYSKIIFLEDIYLLLFYGIFYIYV